MPDVPGQLITSRPPSRAWGQLIVDTIPAPAVGKPWIYRAKAAYLSRVISLRIPLTTSAQVANREQGVKVTDADGKSFYEVIVEGATAAATVCGVSVAANPAWVKRSNSNAVVVPIPDIYLPPEYKLEAVVPGLQTEDVFGEGFALVEQLEPEQYRPVADLALQVAKLHETLEALQYAAR